MAGTGVLPDAPDASDAPVGECDLAMKVTGASPGGVRVARTAAWWTFGLLLVTVLSAYGYVRLAG